MEELINQLQTALANNFALYTETHQNHWDVTGKDFPQYHEFLKRVYQDAADSTDMYGERIRQLGAYPELDFSEVTANMSLPEAIDTGTGELVDPVAIFTQLSAWLEIIITTLQDTFDAATKVREYGIQNFLADRIDAHRQQQWMIHSILGQTP